MIHKQITIHGQFATDCGFRFAAMQKAYEYGVKGYVKRKGSYAEIEAEGSTDSLEKFEQWCSTGPVGCKITNVSSKTGSLKNYSSFDMK